MCQEAPRSIRGIRAGLTFVAVYGLAMSVPLFLVGAFTGPLVLLGAAAHALTGLCSLLLRVSLPGASLLTMCGIGVLSVIGVFCTGAAAWHSILTDEPVPAFAVPLSLSAIFLAMAIALMAPSSLRYFRVVRPSRNDGTHR